MPIKKIDDGPEWTFVYNKCPDPDHIPPTMMVLEPGTYQHNCPTCGVMTTIIVPRKPVVDKT
jgi:hypothetical protein